MNLQKTLIDMIKINSEYSIARMYDGLYLLHTDKKLSVKNLFSYNDEKMGYCYKLCSKIEPKVYLTTQNIGEMVLRKLLPTTPHTACVKKEILPWWDEDPYGRRVQRGSYSYEVWDLSKMFDILQSDELEYIGSEWVSKYRMLSK